MKELIFTLMILLSSSLNYAQNARVIGYLPTYKFSLSEQIAYCKLTHLNLSFGNPDSSGNIIMPPINSVVTDALNENPDMIIMISLAGGVLSTQQAINWSTLIDVPANRPAFIEKIVDYVISNNIDGVDVDLEWSNVTSGYSDFVIELNAALDVHSKLLSAAFPNENLYSYVNEEALNVFDFINIMAYDATGPWDSSHPGQHSTYNFAEQGINYWKNNVGISGDRLNLGLPFYGYNFVNSTTVNSVTYSQMITQNTSYADRDNVGNIYYNGRPTIKAKIELANHQVGGVLVWELGQDSFDEYSLLSTIHNKYTSLGVTTSGLCGNERAILNKPIEVYPNPSSDFIIIKNIITAQNFTMCNAIGVRILDGYLLNNEEIDISHFANGIYFIRLENGITLKFIKL